MNAAALLRDLDKAATAGPWRHSTDYGQVGHVECANGEPVAQAQQRSPYDHDQRNANAGCIATTRNLLPELAALVEAVERQQDAVESDKMEDTGSISEPVWRAMMVVRGAWQALNAKAAGMERK